MKPIWKVVRIAASSVMALALLAMSVFNGIPITSSAQLGVTEPPAPAVGTPTPLINAPDSVPVETGLGANVMISQNWRGFLKATFRLTNQTTSARRIQICIEVNGVSHCKYGDAPANSENVQVSWDYYAMFNLVAGTTYNMWYTVTVPSRPDLPPVLSARFLSTDELSQIGMDVLTQNCDITAQVPAAVNFRPRDDPNITVTVASTIVYTGHLLQDQWSGWIPITVTEGRLTPVIIDATWPGRSPSRDLVYVKTCAPPPCYLLGDYVWVDSDADGIQDPGELGLPGVQVVATGANGTFTRTTDSDGKYLFDCLNLGTYVVRFIPPPDYVFTLPNVGGNEADAIDSDAIGGQVTVPLTQNNLTIDAGFIRTSTASVICFCMELVSGQNVVRWSLSESARDNAYMILRGTSKDRSNATPVYVLTYEEIGPGVHSWSDPTIGTAWYWLVELPPVGESRSYGSATVGSQVCAFIPSVSR